MEQILLDPKTQDSAEFQYKRLFHIFLISHRTKKGDLCLGSDIMELSTCFGLPGGLPRPLTFSRAPPPPSPLRSPKGLLLVQRCLSHATTEGAGSKPSDHVRLLVRPPDHSNMVVQSGCVLNNKKYGFIVNCFSLLYTVVRTLCGVLKNTMRRYSVLSLNFMSS